MLKRILPLLSFVTCCNLVFAQVEFNTTGILGIAYKIDPAGGFPIAESAMLGSPAYLAGIKSNDRMLKINDVSLSGITADALTEKFKIPMGVNIKILVEHEDKTQQEVVMKKAGFITASYKAYKYMIFFDEHKTPLTNDDGWIYYSNDGVNGYVYHVYDATSAFFGEFENSHRKEGLYYYVEDGMPCYYLGEFLNNEYSGKGEVRYFVDGDEFIYTGDYKNGLTNGIGSIKNVKDGHIFTGIFKAGKREGYGKETTADGTLIVEGQWKQGVFQEPAATKSANGYPKVVRDEDLVAPIVVDEAAWKDSIMKKLDTFWEDFDKGVKEQEAAKGYQNNSGSSSSALDDAAAAIVASQKQKGWLVNESFNVGFASGSPGQCSASCSESYRKILVLVEDNISSFKISDIEVSLVRRSNDIEDHEFNKVSFDRLASENGITLYGVNINVPEVRSGCSYIWTINSGDSQARTAKIIVLYGGTY